jgi:glycerol uptake operon antiterminator
MGLSVRMGIRFELQKKFGLTTIQRIFPIDSQALAKAIETCRINEPDAVEAMPGIIQVLINDLVKELSMPIVGVDCLEESKTIN